MSDGSSGRPDFQGAAGRGLIPFRQHSIDVQRQVFAGPNQGDADAFVAFQPRELFAMLMRRIWLIAGVVAACLFLAAAYILIKTPLYKATATLEIQRQETQVIEGVQPAVVADADFMQTQYELLRSRALAERVAETLDLGSDARYADQKAERAERLRQASSVVMNDLLIEPVGRSRMISVAYTSPNADESARIANAVAENFIQSNLERRYNNTAYARSFLEERLNSTKTSLEEAERKLVAYAREKNIIDLGTNSEAGTSGGAALDASALVALNSSLTSAQDARIAAEQKFNEARNNPATLQSLESPAINTLRQQRAQLSTEYQEKLGTFKPEFPEMQDLSRRIQAIDKEVESERANIVAALQTEYRAALARENSLRQHVQGLKGAVQDTQRRSIDYNILAREVDTLRSQYNALLQRFKEVSIISGIGSSQVSIVDRAETPRAPFEPSILKVVLLGLVIGIALALAIAALVEFLDDTIKSPEDLKTKLGLSALGVVPKVKAGVTVIDQLKNPRSNVSEAYASARTALQFATSGGAPRSLLITGTRPGEGKTSTSVGLAYAFAGIGKRVLIIDADLRRPSFDSEPGSSVGLSGLLTSQTSLEGQVVAGQAENIFLLPSGPVPPNPAELLATQRFRDILQDACESFDLVVVDAPPVLDFADSPFLSSVCDVTVMVFQSGAVLRMAAKRTLERLTNSGGAVVGGVLTKFDVKRAGNGYAYGYAEKYGGYGLPSTPAERAADNRRRIALFTNDASGAGPKKL